MKDSSASFGIIYSYLEGPVTRKDIDNFSVHLLNQGIELRSHIKNDVIYASEELLNSVMSISINTPLLLSLINNLIPNMTWDAIKYIVRETWDKTKGEKYFKVTPSKIEERKISLGIKTSLGKRDYNFNIDGMSNSEELNESLDKILLFLQTQVENEHSINKKEYCIGKYNVYKEEWEVMKLSDGIKENINNE